MLRGNDYIGPLMQMMDATAGSGNLLDRLARQDIAGTFFSLTALGRWTTHTHAHTLEPIGIPPG